MPEWLFILLITSIVSGAVIGITRYKYLDNAMRMMVVLQILSACCELASYIAVAHRKYAARYTIYHFYTVFQAFLFTAYFIYAIKPYRYQRMVWASAMFWLVIGVLNVLFLQPLNTLNSNMMMTECFCFTTLSLYYIYHLLEDDTIIDIFAYPHFWMAFIILVAWGSTLFFWAFIELLYQIHWSHIVAVLYIQVLSNILTYFSMAAVLLFYRVNKKLT